MSHLLSIITFLPMAGALAILLLRGASPTVAKNARWIALFFTLADFVLTVILWAKFDGSSSRFQFVEQAGWLTNGISYHMGVDGISMLFMVLTGLLMPFCILASWDSIENRVAEYMVAFLALETLMMGVFAALDLFLFYLFFEGGLIPMFLIIGIWGGKRRVYASYKFFLYTLLGSVLMLLAILAMYLTTGTTDIETIINTAHFPVAMQTWLWLAFFASFAVKMPMWPVHTWLPDAHVEAPTAGSVILAGILLKMGGYGFLRFSLPMFASASATFAPMVFALSVIAIIYTSLVALAQEDMKKLIAYSSVAHMGFVTMGIFTVTHQGIEGGIFQMLSHGIVTGALFLCVGVVYDRMHTREIAAYGGLVNRMPVYAACFMVFTLANVGLPGTGGFVGEFLTMLGAFVVNSWIAIFAATGTILSAAYALFLYRRIMFGELVKPALQTIRDLSMREVALLAPLVVITVFMGVYPKPIFDITSASVANLVQQHKAAVARAAGESDVASANSGTPPVPDVERKSKHAADLGRPWKLSEREIKLIVEKHDRLYGASYDKAQTSDPILHANLPATRAAFLESVDPIIRARNPGLVLDRASLSGYADSIVRNGARTQPRDFAPRLISSRKETTRLIESAALERFERLTAAERVNFAEARSRIAVAEGRQKGAPFFMVATFLFDVGVDYLTRRTVDISTSNPFDAALDELLQDAYPPIATRARARFDHFQVKENSDLAQKMLLQDEAMPHPRTDADRRAMLTAANVDNQIGRADDFIFGSIERGKIFVQQRNSGVMQAAALADPQAFVARAAAALRKHAEGIVK